MHDLHEANKIANLIKEHAKKNGLKKVTRAVIELGQIIEHGEEINPENLRFNIKMLLENSPADGLEAIVKTVKGRGWNLKEIEGES